MAIRTIRNSLRLLALLLVTTLVAAACGTQSLQASIDERDPSLTVETGVSREAGETVTPTTSVATPPATTEPPSTTEAPTTEPPSTTEAPSTSAPTTEPPDATTTTVFSFKPLGPTEPPAEPVASVDLTLAGEKLRTESYRAEVSLEMTVGDDSFSFSFGGEDPVAQIAHDGARTATTMDIGALLGSLIGDDSQDLSFTTVVDDEHVYLLVPKDLLEGPAQQYAGRWVRVPISSLTEEDFAALSGGGLTDVESQLALLDDVGEVTDLGADELRGRPVQGYRVETTLAVLLEAQGEFTTGQMTTDLGDAGDLLVSYDVWVDAEGRLAAIETNLDETTFAAIADATGEPTDGASFSLHTRGDFYDVGADFTVEVPADAVDVDPAVVDSLATA